MVIKMESRMTFGEWCKQDMNDTTPINYTFKLKDGTVKRFTSEDSVTGDTILKLYRARVEEITKDTDKNVWNAVIYED